MYAILRKKRSSVRSLASLLFPCILSGIWYLLLSRKGPVQIRQERYRMQQAHPLHTFRSLQLPISSRCASANNSIQYAVQKSKVLCKGTPTADLTNRLEKDTLTAGVAQNALVSER